MIERPPVLDERHYFKPLIKMQREDKLAEVVENINNKYEYWSDVKYTPLPEGVSSAEELWSCVKASRWIKYNDIWDRYNIRLCITNRMLRMCHEFDMNFGGSWGADSTISDTNRKQYLVSSLMEEAISSSQMEGAATTRKVAKDMLRKEITPQGRSQRMIYNNYQTICFITENKDANLTPELLLKIHQLMTENTLENEEDVGRYRINDDVVVEDGITHETVHVPPIAQEVPLFIDELCRYFNEKEAKSFVHPIIRGIIIHFMVAYVHPFADGNGRTARVLFYWSMLKNGYWLTEYLSISRIISKSKKAYEKAYLYSEYDGNDIGYFVTYNLKVLDSACKEFKLYIQRQAEKQRQASHFLALGNINQRQAEIINVLHNSPNALFTIKELVSRFSIVAATAKSDMDGLIALGLVKEIALNRVKKGFIRGEHFDDTIKNIL